MSIRIKNWSKLQHFKDRTPPWIKLYRDLLDDPDWHDLDGESSKILIGLWLIASEDETRSGLLPDNRKLAFRLRISENQLNQILNNLNHWLIQDDINVISERYQVDAPETETETETEREGETETEAEKKVFSHKKRGTRLPENFELPNDWITFCSTERPDLNPLAIFQQFKDYWIAQTGTKATKADWFATWRNWVRNQKQTFSKQTQILEHNKNLATLWRPE